MIEAFNKRNAALEPSAAAAAQNLDCYEKLSSEE